MSPCSKALKMCGSAAALMPMPVSSTLTTTQPSASLQVLTVIVPPVGVNLSAFLIRFQITCWSRAGSASAWCRSAARVKSIRTCLLSPSLRTISAVCWMSSCRSVGAGAMESLPRLIRVRSSRSSMSRASSSMLRRIIPSCSRNSVGSSGSLASAVAIISTGVSGVRSSWLSAARKSSLAREADSACSLAKRRFSTDARRSVISRKVHTQPIGVPPRWTGDPQRS